MGKFFFKTCMLLLLLLFGVIFGMQQANQNMKKMQGYNDPKMYEAFTIDKQDNGEVQASLLGNQFTTKNMAEKQQQVEEWKGFNLFSSAGRGISAAFTSVFENMAKLIAEL